MTLLRPIAFATLLVLMMGPVVVPQSPDRLEKIAEGEYSQWVSGHPIKDTTQSWTIWRTKDGFDVDGTLHPDAGILFFAAIGQGDLPASQGLRDEAQNAVVAMGINFRLDQGMGIATLRVNGKRLVDGKPAVVADCVSKPAEISCKGRMGTVKLKNAGGEQLSYSCVSPLIYMPLLKQTKLEPGQSVPVKLALFEEVKNKPQLSEVSGQLRNQGLDKLSIGERVFEGEKFSLSLETKAGPRQITLWTSKQGIIFGMQDSQLEPGFQILITKYKKYAEF
jgi:hypothetical protein